jgi:hypothetical protein
LKDPAPKTVNPNRWNASRFLWRLLAACFAVIAFLYVIGPFYIRLLLPVFTWEIEFLNPQYKVVEGGIVSIGQINYLQLDIEVNKPMPPGRQGAGDSGHITRHKAQASSLCIAPIIIFSLILAWPSLPIKRRLKAFIFSLPLIVLVECLDYPIIFIANISSVYSDNILLNTVLKIWSYILSNGGRQFLALIAFFVVIAPHYITPKYASPRPIDRKSAQPGRNAPCPCGSGRKYKNCCLRE